MLASDSTLRITEIFCSLQGESSWVGHRTVFVRLTGCPLRCSYCDSAYAFEGGDIMRLDAIMECVASYAADYVCVTGGEPLAQPNCLGLLSRLCDVGYQVSLETSGALDIAAVDSRVKRIVDLKTPSSGEENKNRYSNIEQLNHYDEVKFVIADQADYEWSKQILEQYALPDKTGHILLSPVFPLEGEESSLQHRTLAEWVIADKLPVRMQLQMHKLLWGNQAGH